MDSYDFDNIKAEKAKAMKRYQTQENIKKILYTLELCIVLVSIPCFLNWFPLALKICFIHLKNFIFQFFHKTFYVFLLTNVMVFILAICFYLKRDDECLTKTDIYEEFVNASESSTRNLTPRGDFPVPEFKDSKEPPTYVDKEVVYSVNAVKGSGRRESKHAVDSNKHAPIKADDGFGAMLMRQQKELRRSSTENHRKVEQRELRRSKTGYYGGTMRCVEEPPRRSVDEMSGEEFRSEIEKFIAMQKRMQSEEGKNEKTQPCLAIISRV